jgi:uncharacterized membrane protein YccC
MSETILVGAIVAVAAAWLGWRAWTFLRGKRTGCGCDRCPAVNARKAPGAAPSHQK